MCINTQFEICLLKILNIWVSENHFKENHPVIVHKNNFFEMLYIQKTLSGCSYKSIDNESSLFFLENITFSIV